MATKAGVGYSEKTGSRQAGVEAAGHAITEAGVGKCDLAIIYSTSRHDPVQLRDGVRSVIGPTARLVGGYSIGTITKDRLGYDGYQAGVAVISSDSICIDMFIEKKLPDNEYNVGIALGKQIKSKYYADTPNILLMYDAIKERPSEDMAFNFNLATPLIEGIGQSLDPWPPAAGAGLVGDWQGNPTYQWFDDRIEQHSAIALVLSGRVQMDTIIMHGCKPSSGYHTITKVDNATVLEIDGKPAVKAVTEILSPSSGENWQDYPFFVTLGVNRGDKFGEFNPEEYANRMVMGIDRERDGLVMFENDLKEGAEFQFMQRTLDDFNYVRNRAEELLKRVGNRKPFFALYIDCGGRASAYCGTEGEEAEEVQKVIGSVTPLLGMYSGVEIAKVGGGVQALDWTGVLCIFSE